MISLQRTADLCFCQTSRTTRWVQNGGGDIFKNLWKVSNESNWIWGQVWLHCTVSRVLHTQEHLQTTLHCLLSIAHPWALTNCTVPSLEYCTLISIYKLHCTVSGILHTHEHLQTTLYYLQSTAHLEAFTNLGKDFIQLFEPAALSEAICHLLIYIRFTQILGSCFLNVLLILYSFFKIYLSSLNFNFKQKQRIIIFPKYSVWVAGPWSEMRCCDSKLLPNFP